MPQTSAWHLGHILAAYQNAACPTCLAEQRRHASPARTARRDLPASRKTANGTARERHPEGTEAMSEIDRLRALLAELTEGCEPGPWHGKRAAFNGAECWWLDNPAGDSSFPEPDDVAAMLNTLPALLDAADSLARLVKAWDDGVDPEPANWAPLDREINAALAQAHVALDRLDGAL